MATTNEAFQRNARNRAVRVARVPVVRALEDLQLIIGRLGADAVGERPDHERTQALIEQVRTDLGRFERQYAALHEVRTTPLERFTVDPPETDE